MVLAPTLALAGPRGPASKKRKPAPATEAKPAEPPAETAETPEAGASRTDSDASTANDVAAKPEPPSASPAPSSVGPNTSAPPTASKPADKSDSPGTDVDSLRQEYLSLRDELFRSRARASAVSGQLYSSRVEIRFTWSSGRYYGVSKASVRLDGATVYEDSTGAIAGNDGIRFSGYVAPGRHTIVFHVEATGKDDDSFTSATDAQIAVKAVANKDLLVAAKAHDVGDIAYEWKRSEHGGYGLGVDVAVKTAARADASAAPKAKK